ncbi:hypothetical protein BELL_1182g00010 [Botrytis elliptica]|uniref:Uncharacterized protein n=1 Tax=Botrytis elliptica TaxID=278938 RepID=A0A4Z1INS0_9HELO|nr:hypothetical protein BELL_1182g00010 [Botrytis elliptica]
MDPLSAIGLAGTIVQFVDFSCKIVGHGVELYKEGSLELNKQVEYTTRDLRNFVVKLQAQPSKRAQKDATADLSENDLALEKLCRDCNEVAEELLERLSRLEVKITPPKEPEKNASKNEIQEWKIRYYEYKKQAEKLGKTLRIGLLNVWNREQIQETAERLERYRVAIQTRLLGALVERVNTLSLQQSHRFDNLDVETKRIVSALLEDVRTNLSKDIRHQTEALAQLINQREIVIKGENKKRRVVDIDQDLGQDEAFPIEEARKQESSIRLSINREILKSLDFEAQNERYEGVCEAHKRTFEWIFQDSRAEDVQWDSFVDWLKTGDGLYWIQGKAGSGKSTLMKYICYNPSTKQNLSIWANSKTLYTAEFYFWALGPHTLQKSQIGLLRALLYQILEQSSDLIPVVCPEQWAALYASISLSNSSKMEPWTLSALSSSWKRLIKSFSAEDCQSKLAVFVDGLDEFEGLDSDIAKLFRAAAKSPHVKFCVSSRPERAYEKAFEELPSLKLQDLTHNDIRSYVEDRLVKDENMEELLRREPVQAEELVDEVVKTANGVFLWVYLVISSLLKGLSNDDEIADLQRELRRLPKSLKDLYIHMIVPDGEIRYRQEAITFFQLVNATQFLDGDLHVPEPMNILGMCLAMEPDEKVAAMTKGFIADPNAMAPVFKNMSRRLKSRTGGLLEVQVRGTKAMKILPNMAVAYLHRTVQEFLITPEMRVFFQEETDFNPDHAMLKSCVYQLQIMNPEDRDLLWLSAINYARRNQMRGPSPQSIFLDQLYTKTPRRKYIGHGSELKRRYIGDVNNVPVYRLSNNYEYFLYMAVEFDLHMYLREVLDINQQFPTGIVKRNLLRYALNMKYSTSPETMLTLLSCGCDAFDSSILQWQPGSARRKSKTALEKERTAILRAAIRYLDNIYPSGHTTDRYERELKLWANVLQILVPPKASRISSKIDFPSHAYGEAIRRLYAPFPELQKWLLSHAEDASEASIRKSCRTQ